MSEESQVVHNTAQHRFETEVEGHLSVLNYQKQGDTLYFTHTGVPHKLEGRGIAGRLVKAGLDYARSEGLQVVPACSFVDAYIRRHPAYRDLVSDEA